MTDPDGGLELSEGALRAIIDGVTAKLQEAVKGGTPQGAGGSSTGASGSGKLLRQPAR